MSFDVAVDVEHVGGHLVRIDVNVQIAVVCGIAFQVDRIHIGVGKVKGGVVQRQRGDGGCVFVNGAIRVKRCPEAAFAVPVKS